MTRRWSLWLRSWLVLLLSAWLCVAAAASAAPHHRAPDYGLPAHGASHYGSVQAQPLSEPPLDTVQQRRSGIAASSPRCNANLIASEDSAALNVDPATVHPIVPLGAAPPRRVRLYLRHCSWLH